MAPNTTATLVSVLAERGMTRDEFCKQRADDLELAGLVSQNAADGYCRRGPRTLKRSGSIANNKMPEPLKAYWNYETKDEKLVRTKSEAAKAGTASQQR